MFNFLCKLCCTLPPVNKRLDEWVVEDNVDAERLQLPRKESKIGNLTKSSRQASPVEVATPPSSELGLPRKHGGISRGN